MKYAQRERSVESVMFNYNYYKKNYIESDFVYLYTNNIYVLDGSNCG